MGRGRDPAPEQLGPEQFGSWQQHGPRTRLRFDTARLRCEGPPGGAAFADLVAASNYSFLRGASHPSDMVARALELGHAGIGIADRNTVAGVVRAWAAFKEIRKEG